MTRFTMLVGLPASGKTTYVETLKADMPHAVHLESDKIREDLGITDFTKASNGKVFALMNSRTVDLLSRGIDVIYDATNLSRKNRVNLLSQIPECVDTQCIILWSTLTDLCKRDSERKRTVGIDVIYQMLMSFQIPYYDEGFDKIFVKYPENFAEMSSDYTDKLVRSMDIPQDNPHHQHTVLDHCARAIFYLDFKSIEYKQELYYATKFHDCGKPLTKTFKDCRGNTTDIAHYYNHQNAGSYLILGCCETVQCADLIMISWLINRHMDPYLNTRYYRNLDIHNKQLIDALHTADIIAH